MILDFQNGKEKRKEKNKYKPMNDWELYNCAVEEMDKLDVEDALRGAIMAATGQNVVCGIDYTLRKEECIEQARRYNFVMGTIFGLCAKAESMQEKNDEE